MICFTFLAFQVLIWQSQDISVDIVSDTEEGSNEVTISVKNTAGTVLLFHENDEMTGKIEYLSDEGWVEYCDVYYTQGNATAVSQQYSGTFAELEPGEDWEIVVPEEKVAGMKNGTYRIKLAYVTENKYKQYLEELYEESLNGNISDEESIFEESEAVSDEEAFEESFDVSLEDSEANGGIFGEIDFNFNGIFDDTSKEEDEEVEEYYASSVSELFVKTFEYEVPADFVSQISFDESNIKGDEDVNTPYSSRMRITEEVIY